MSICVHAPPMDEILPFIKNPPPLVEESPRRLSVTPNQQVCATFAHLPVKRSDSFEIRGHGVKIKSNVHALSWKGRKFVGHMSYFFILGLSNTSFPSSFRIQHNALFASCKIQGLPSLLTFSMNPHNGVSGRAKTLHFG